MRSFFFMVLLRPFLLLSMALAFLALPAAAQPTHGRDAPAAIQPRVGGEQPVERARR